ncbi:MAG: PH domain-containing protein [Candidatus Micrarchaeota archaeon]
MPPRYLDARVKWVWFIPTIIALVIVWVILVSVIFLLSQDNFFFGMPKPVFSAVFMFFLAAFIGLPIFLYNHIEYMSFTYELAENEFVIRQGVITRHTTVIPYNRIQNINTTRTLLERVVGLATLQIETAGTNPHESEGVLPGVSKKDILISEIMLRVEKVKKDGIIPSDEIKGGHTELGQILKELKDLNKRLSDRGSLGPAKGPGANRNTFVRLHDDEI